MNYDLNANRAYNLAFLAVHKLINDLHISDEFKAYLLDRHYYEYDALDNLSNKELDKLALLVNYKYKDVNKNCYDYIKSFGDDISFIKELEKVKDLNI